MLNLSLKKILNPFFEEEPSYILIHLFKNEVSVKINGRKYDMILMDVAEHFC